MSGHSKWAQIKHKKALTDAKKSQLFSKMVREIAVAARAGGVQPENNSRLKTALEHARSIGLPKENADRAIARAAGGSAEENLQEFIYEATYPSGVMIIIEGITDNKNRSLSEIKKTLTRFGARLADPGSILWNFEKVGLLELTEPENPDKTREALETAIIESGARDFHPNVIWDIETNFQEMEIVRQNLEKAGIKIRAVTHDYKPKSTADVSAEDKKSCEELLDALTDLDDVQEAYSNLKEE